MSISHEKQSRHDQTRLGFTLVEQSAIHEAIDLAKPLYVFSMGPPPSVVTHPDLSDKVATTVPTFLCPSDVHAEVSSEWGATNYHANNGSATDGGVYVDCDGLFYIDSRKRFRDILDGTSHTATRSRMSYLTASKISRLLKSISRSWLPCNCNAITPESERSSTT